MRKTLVTAIILAALIAASPSTNVNLHTAASPNEEWMSYAETAWKYFQPGVGVSRSTGLNYATSTYHYFTDWDLGCYISAIIDAESIGLLGKDGDWGSDYRIDKIISFLKTRQLTDSGLPYWFYSSDDGSPVTSKGQGNPSDSGRLLVALYLLKQHRPELASDIDSIMARTNYAKFAESCSTDGFYAYYLAHGYGLFGFNTSSVQKALGFVDRIPSMEHVQVYSQSLPVTEVIMEPILHAIFEVEVTQEFGDQTYKAYKVQEDRYAATGKPTAFTEGAYDASPNYIYEWIVHPSKKVWYITTPTWDPMNVAPVIYTKAALAMHAIWPSSYTEKLVDYVLPAKTDKGFYEGVDENGRVLGILTDKTNSLIINAARYALDVVIQPELSISLSQESVILHVNESVNVTVNVGCPLPVDATLSISGLPDGVTATFIPQGGTTDFTSTLTLSATSSATVGTYSLNITAQSPDAKQASATLTLTVEPKAQGCTLRIRVMDWDMENPIANATVHMDGEAKTSDADGYVEWDNLTGDVTVGVSFLGVWVSDPIPVEMDADRTIDVQCRFYDIYVRAVTTSGKPVPNINFTFSLSGEKLSSAVTNGTGYAYFQNLPASNLTLTAYGGPNYTVKLGEWTEEVYMEGQIIDPSINDNNAAAAIPQPYLTVAVAFILVSAIITLLKLRLKQLHEAGRR